MSLIYQALCRLSQDDLYYLKSLNQIETVDLNLYRALTESFASQEIKALLHDSNWREQIIAYSCVMAQMDHSFIPVLRLALERGSYIAPQLVVALAILGRREIADFLTEMLLNPQSSSTIKGAIVAVLPHCYVNEVRLCDASIELDDFSCGYEVAKEHLEFWLRG